MGSGCGGQDKMFLSKRQDFAFYADEYCKNGVCKSREKDHNISE
jgi:hypothetical protein